MSKAKTSLAFISLSFAWSLSWFAMKLQTASFVPIEISLFYRLFFTSILTFALCIICKERILLSRNEFKFIIPIGLFGFCINFLLGYYAVRFVSSCTIAAFFSLSIIVSEIIDTIFSSRPVERKVIASGIVGFTGIILFIMPSIKFSNNRTETLLGLIMILLMVLSYSLSGFLVSKNKKINNTPLYTTIANATLYGSVITLIANTVIGNNFVFDFSFQYIASLSYLILIASLLAFICLFYLIQTIGGAKANYTALVYPTIALIISNLYEGFKFEALSAFGFCLIISALLIDFLFKSCQLRRN